MEPTVVSSKNFSTTGSNYIRNSDIAPVVNDANQIVMFNGKSGRHISVRSAVRQLTADVVEIDVTGWDKFTVSPRGGSYYFVAEGGQWVRRTANAKAVKAALAN